jgi:hypothetical protein
MPVGGRCCCTTVSDGPPRGRSGTWNGFPQRGQAVITGRAPEPVSTRPRCGRASAGTCLRGNLWDLCRSAARRRASAWVRRGRQRPGPSPRAHERRVLDESAGVVASLSAVADHRATTCGLPRVACDWCRRGASGLFVEGTASSQRPGCAFLLLSPLMIFGLPCVGVRRSSSVTKGALEGPSDQSVQIQG